jgi:hypothetical protein
MEVEMIEEEAFQLLTLASARDNRTVSQSIAKVWAGDLARVSLDDATAALTLHYQERPDVWLLPGHVIAAARRVRATREREANIEASFARRAIGGNVITLDREKFERETQAAIEAQRAIKAGKS